MFSVALVRAAVFGAIAALIGLVFFAGRPDPDAVPAPSEVAGRVMSPFCPGLSLDECPSSQAGDLRAKIKARVEQGATNREIDRWLVENYGESVLGRPPQALSWVVPAGFVMVGLAVLLITLGRGAGSRHRPHEDDGEVDSEEGPGGEREALRAQMLEELSVFGKGTE